MKKYLVIVLFLLISTGCSNHKINQFDSGRVENDKYINTFFGFDITLPQGWFAQTKKHKNGNKFVGNENDAKLLTVFKYNSPNNEYGQPVLFNPSIIVASQNLKNVPEIKT
ncbi:MAG: hypothetical protein GY760_19865 [Deltaproteobacteria bacterium]|nr:hypothetical protein [Deltaproteobacteria bacterium]